MVAGPAARPPGNAVPSVCGDTPFAGLLPDKARPQNGGENSISYYKLDDVLSRAIQDRGRDGMAADSYRPMTTLARDDPPGGPRDQNEQGEPPTVADLPAVGDQRGELVLAREIRAREMVAGRTPAQIAAVIRAECLPGFCTTWIRAHRLALGIALADVVAQVRARRWPGWPAAAAARRWPCRPSCPSG